MKRRIFVTRGNAMQIVRREESKNKFNNSKRKRINQIEFKPDILFKLKYHVIKLT